MRGIRLALKISGTLFLLALAALLLAGWFQIRLPLAVLNAPLSSALGNLLGREVGFAGDIHLVPSLHPSLEVSQATIANAHWGRAPQLATFGRMQLQLSLPALFSGRLHVDGMSAEKVTINLESNPEGKPNWAFSSRGEAHRKLPGPSSEGPALRLSALDRIELHHIQLNYLDMAVNHTLSFRLDQLTGSLPRTKDMRLKMEGSLQSRPYRLRLQGGSLQALQDPDIPWELELEGRLGNSGLKAKGRLERQPIPRIDTRLELEGVDLGRLLSGLVKDLDAGFRRLEAHAVLQGNSLSRLLTESRLSVQLKQGHWRLRDANSGKALELSIPTAELQVRPGKPVTMKLAARANELPVKLRITGAPAPDYLQPGKALPLNLVIETAGATAHLEAKGTRPIDIRSIPFHLSLSGQRLADLGQLLRRELPPLGRYQLEGTFTLPPRGYQVRDLELAIGDSRLRGELSLDTRSRPPRLEVSLHSPRIQLDDFHLKGWSPLPRTEEGVKQRPGTGTRHLDQARALLSPESLAAQDLELRLKVDQVLSGPDSLGGGSLAVKLTQGRLTIDPLHLSLPGGDARLNFLYHPRRKGEIELALGSRVENFDYGILARRIDPRSKVGGRLSLRVDLQARGEGIQALLENGKGRFDFGLWPQQLQADLFDLWAVNVLTSLLRKLDESQSSKVNCVIARLQLEDGVMHDRILFADTSRMQVEASATIDFRKQMLDIRARPRPKKAQFFSLATPARLTGRFDNFRIHLNPVELGGTIFSFVTSPLHVPLQRLFGGEIPADGQEACRKAWNYESEAAGKSEKRLH